MNKKLKVVIKILDNPVAKYPEAKDYIENNMQEACEGENMIVEEVIYFADFVQTIVFANFRQMVLFFHALAALFYRVKRCLFMAKITVT